MLAHHAALHQGRGFTNLTANLRSKPLLLRRRTSRTLSANTETAAVSPPVAVAANWQKFAEAFSGEWEGVTATFDANGEKQPLDAHYVPAAYREWGVEVYDWQTTCSCLADGNQPWSSQMITRRMMPTVGCEADAVAFTEESSHGEHQNNNNDHAIVAFTTDGSYIAVPQKLTDDATRINLEVSLVHSSPAGDTTESKPMRVRIVQQLQRHWQTKQWMLAKVDVHNEKWDSPYRGKVELCGCGGGMPVFATTAVIDQEQIPQSRPISSWHQQQVFVPTADGMMQPVSIIGEEEWDRSLLQMLPEQAVQLPLGIWLRCNVKENSIAFEVGAVPKKAEDMQQQNGIRVARCLYQAGQLAACGIGTL